MDENYWTERYLAKATGWDVGYATPPIVTYFDSLPELDKSKRILIPGAGNSYEAAHLYQNGYEHVHICDISPIPLENFQNEHPSFPSNQILLADFFTLTETFDIIIEQTFFCALAPSLRKDYVEQMYNLLSPNGYIVGLLFDRVFERQGPPFGGSTSEYKTLFEEKFSLEKMEPCTSSITPRLGSEVFIKLDKKR